MFRENQQTCEAWAAETFGEAKSDLVITTRANEELAELLHALAKDTFSPESTPRMR